METTSLIKARPHPAVYNDALLPVFARMLNGATRILDPFGGTGKVFHLAAWLPTATIQAIEIEPEFAAHEPRVIIGDALALPFRDAAFDAICTSPTYGNRMADKPRPQTSIWQKGVTTYADKLGRQLAAHNSGGLQWGAAYQEFHCRAWAEVVRVLRPGGRFVLNIKDHIRNNVKQEVTAWHEANLARLGLRLVEHVTVPCPGMRFGRNGDKRVDHESVILFRKRE